MKKLITILLCTSLLFACNNEKTKQGSLQVQALSATQAIQKIEKKSTFLLLVSRPQCYPCKAFKQMLASNKQAHDFTLYDVSMNDSNTTTLTQQVEQLSKYLEQPSRTPHVYYIVNGKTKNEFIGFDESKPKEFWDWTKQQGIK